jgi:hypothetical protein
VSAILAMWTAEIDATTKRIYDALGYHVWCPTDVLRALYHVRRAGLTYEGASRMEGRVNYWERKRRLGRLPESFDIEAQIQQELAAR